jgi:hypothetical protein
MTKQINGDKLFVIDPHPAIPPSDQLKKWEDKWFDEEEHPDVLLIQAFQAGADQELEACVEWLGDAPVVWDNNGDLHPGSYLRDARRPKPSLKQQAMCALIDGIARGGNDPSDIETIRRALEALPE